MHFIHVSVTFVHSAKRPHADTTKKKKQIQERTRKNHKNENRKATLFLKHHHNPPQFPIGTMKRMLIAQVGEQPNKNSNKRSHSSVWCFDLHSSIHILFRFSFFKSTKCHSRFDIADFWFEAMFCFYFQFGSPHRLRYVSIWMKSLSHRMLELNPTIVISHYSQNL